MNLRLFVTACLICLLVSCGGNSNTKNSSRSSEQASDRSLTSSSAMNSSTGFEGVLVSYGDNRMQVGELRLPDSTSTEPVPLVIIIHGGCWISALASYRFMDTFSEAITDFGYATWNIEYRALGTGGAWPTIFQDVGSAVDYTRILAHTYPIDISNIAVIGHSAGGHLALWAASRTTIKNDNELYTENPLVIKGAISLAGVADVTGIHACSPQVSEIIGMATSPTSETLTNRLLTTSPHHMLPSSTTTVLISGSLDNLVPPAMGTEYSNKASSLGDTSTHYILEGLNHFDLIDPSKTNWSLYQQSLEEIFSE